jgi:hypothetical protein
MKKEQEKKNYLNYTQKQFYEYVVELQTLIKLCFKSLKY